MSEFNLNDAVSDSAPKDHHDAQEVALINNNVSYVESSMNLSLLDSNRWGWSAVGGIADLLTPHERARRKSTRKSILQCKLSGRKRTREEAFQTSPIKLATTPNDNGTLTVDFVNSDGNTNKPVIMGETLSQSSINITKSESAVKAAGKKRSSNRKLSVNDKRKTKRNKPVQSTSVGRSGKVRYKSLQKNQTHLDIRIYHKGREGVELRDDKTFELVFATVKDEDENDIVTESNNSIDTEPKTLQFPVTISFLLDEEEESSDKSNIFSEEKTHMHRNRSGRDDKVTEGEESARYYTTTVKWNLGDPYHPTPNAFATQVAEEYGLTYIQTLEVSDSIQKQIHAFIEENCRHTPSIALRGIMSSSPSQHLLSYKPIPVVPILYGEASGGGSYSREGYCVPQCIMRSKLTKLPRTTSAISSRSSGSKVSEGKDQIRISNRKSNNATNNMKAAVPTKRSTSELTTLMDTVKPNKAIKKSALNIQSIYSFEVLQRLLKASIDDIRQKGCNAVVFQDTYFCHYCKEKKQSCGVFACGKESHAYCEHHLSEKTVARENSGLSYPRTLEYCPICSLTCDCIDCVTKLESAASAFRKKCLKQGVSPDSTHFPDLFEYCQHLKGIEKRKVLSKKAEWNHSNVELTCQSEVPKVSLHDFPREVAMGIDLDNGYDMFYNTVFTANGSYLGVGSEIDASSIANVQQQPTITTEPEVVEDGNVDYCNVCRSEGNLLCCDFCPRAFHSYCMAEKDRCLVGSAEGEKWECPSCRYEKVVMTEDFLTGEYSIMQVASAFNDTVSDGYNANILQFKLLSIVFDMIQRLMDYDFGYMFKDPVDTKQIPLYRSVVKRPMDIGTISSNIMKGAYKDKIRDVESSLDDVVLSVLKDVELVWHNCFIFNSDGSAVYRMAEVQQRRANEIRRASFDHLLSDHVKSELSKFVETCEKERALARRDKPPKTVSRASVSASRYKVKHKICGTAPFKSGKGRPVAVFDSDTGKIVKIYATIQSASKVINFFLDDMKFQCEVTRDQISSHIKVRNYIDECRTNYGNRLFGYRWLLLDDLRDKKVKFPPPGTKSAEKKPAKRFREASTSGEDEELVCLIGLIEMIDGNNIYIFNSIEESLSFPGTEAEIASRKKQLVRLSPGFDFRDTVGRIWKKLAPDAADVIETKPIFKMDLISDAHLMSFSSVESAFVDWIQTLDASPEHAQDRTIEVFTSQYLDGTRNVDGICWRKRQVDTIETGDPSLMTKSSLNDMEHGSQPLAMPLVYDDRPDLNGTYVTNREGVNFGHLQATKDFERHDDEKEKNVEILGLDGTRNFHKEISDCSQEILPFAS